MLNLLLSELAIQQLAGSNSTKHKRVIWGMRKANTEHVEHSTVDIVLSQIMSSMTVIGSNWDKGTLALTFVEAANYSSFLYIMGAMVPKYVTGSGPTHPPLGLGYLPQVISSSYLYTTRPVGPKMWIALLSTRLYHPWSGISPSPNIGKNASNPRIFG